jgi:hypothetical protein
MIQMVYPNNDAVFQDENAPIHTARTVQSWFDENEGELHHLPWPAQSPHLNIIAPLWIVLENRLRNKFPPPTSLKQFEHIHQVEWYTIPLETVQDLYEPIQRRTAAVLKEKDGTTPY